MIGKRSQSLVMLALLAVLTACTSSPDPSFSSTAITTATVGQEYRYEIQIADGTPADVSTDSSTYPDWLELEVVAAISDITEKVREEPGLFFLRGLTAAANGDLYYFDTFQPSQFADITFNLFRKPADGGAQELVLADVCEEATSCNDLLIVGNTLYMTQYNDNFISKNKVYQLDLSNPASGFTLFTSAVPYPTALTAKADGNIYVASSRSGVYRVSIDDPADNELVLSRPANMYGDIIDTAFDPNGTLYFVDRNNGIYQDDGADGRWYLEGKGFESMVWANATLYVARNEDDQESLREISSSGSTLSSKIITETRVRHLMLHPNGKVIFTNSSARTVQEFNRATESATLFGTPAVADLGSHAVELALKRGKNKQTFTIVVSGGEYTVGGVVNDLAGSIELTNNDSGIITLTNTSVGNRTFAFSEPLLQDDTYSVSIQSQPQHQTCDIQGASGAGTVGNSNVTSVVIDCVFKSYSIGGSISGLTGVLEITAGGQAYTFDQNDTEWLLEDLTALVNVQVTDAPAGYNCTIGSSGAGISLQGDITDADITCSAQEFPVNVSVTGLTGTLGLQINNIGQVLSITADGDYAFNNPLLAYDSGYSVAVTSQPAGQTCTLANETGTVSDSTTVNVTCGTTPPTPSRTLSVTVVGLPADGTTVPMRSYNPGESLAMAVGTTAFPSTLDDGEEFDIRVLSSPAGYSCTITNEAPASAAPYDAVDGFGIVDGDVVVTVTCNALP